jgi:adenylosuccinate synthase
MKVAEYDAGLVGLIGSTGSGTGEAVIRRIQRKDNMLLAQNFEELKPYIKNTKSFLNKNLENKKRIIIEGTQGFGLSLLHSAYYPYVTSRDTTASGFLSEVGLSPLDVDDVVLTIRAFPIRVAGNSGPLRNKINWEIISKEGKHEEPIEERTSVTNRVRKVARFDPLIVREAIEVNRPTRIVLNHLDYVFNSSLNNFNQIIDNFVSNIEKSLERKVDFLGFSPKDIQRKEQRFIPIEVAYVR